MALRDKSQTGAIWPLLRGGQGLWGGGGAEGRTQANCNNSLYIVISTAIKGHLTFELITSYCDSLFIAATHLYCDSLYIATTHFIL